MAYTRNPTWQDHPNTSTPITAAKLEHIEAGIEDAHDAIDALGSPALNDLTDVDTTGQTTGDVLKYNGTSWIADTASAGTVSSTDITDSTATGRAVLTAADAATARTAIGAGTSNLDGVGVSTIWSGSQAAYDAITTPDPDTLYFVTG